MPTSLNKVQVIGHLGRDPEARYMHSGTMLVSFTVAASRSWRDKDTQEWKEETEWVNCSAFSPLAEHINERLYKGAKVYVEGRLKTRKWEKDGTTHYRTEVNVSEFILLDRKAKGDDPGAYVPPTADDDEVPF